MNNIIDEITIIYNIKDCKDKIRIFGNQFVNNNKNNCKINVEDKDYELSEDFELKNINSNNNTLKIILIINLKKFLKYIIKW
jgi:hypothetical protein